MAIKSIVSNEARVLHGNVIDKISTLIISAFGLVAALAWNNAIQKIISMFMGVSDQALGLVVYAVIVTLIAVIVTIYMTRLAGKINAKR
jgi:thiosulfate reductase cytochrome b subunit